MKVSLLTTGLVLIANFAVAKEQKVFTCVSAVDGQQITAELPAEGEMGHVVFHATSGDATVLHALNGVTFLHINGEDVWTLALNTEDMTYQLSVHGSELFEDHGTCEAASA